MGASAPFVSGGIMYRHSDWERRTHYVKNGESVLTQPFRNHGSYKKLKVKFKNFLGRNMTFRNIFKQVESKLAKIIINRPA